jgi:hypothetical protein
MIVKDPQQRERPTLAADLEAQRLEHRSRRMDLVVEALRDRVSAYQRHGTVPPPLMDAVTEFSRRLHDDRARLAELRRGEANRSRRSRHTAS